MKKGQTTQLLADAREKDRRRGIAIVSYKWLLAWAEQADIVDVTSGRVLYTQPYFTHVPPRAGTLTPAAKLVGSAS